MAWFTKRNLPQQVKRPQAIALKPKKGKCKIKFKKKEGEDQIEFSPECSSQQIEMAKQMRAERGSQDD